MSTRNLTDVVVNTLSTKNNRRVVLWAPPLFIIDPQANVWEARYSKRVNEINPIGRKGSIRQAFGTKSPHFRIEGKLNFENYHRKWNRYFKGLELTDNSMLFDPRSVKYIMEYLLNYNQPIVMKCDYDISLVTLDDMSWRLDGDKRMQVSYKLDLYEIKHIPIAFKYSANLIGVQ